MIDRMFRVRFATFPYGGNGASAREHPDVRNWLVDTVQKAQADPRIHRTDLADYNDTPVTMTRNRAVREALRDNVDFLVMVDSDQAPDLYLGQDPEAEPFWDASFAFLQKHWGRGPACVGAPYLGGPPHENVFVFLWQNFESEHPNPDFKVRQYTREEAASMRGIQECAALPTGLIMFDTRLFRLTQPQPSTLADRFMEMLRPLATESLTPLLIENLGEWLKREELSSTQSWFYYEYTDELQSEKASTEDVTATRDLSLAGLAKLGYNPVHCAWSSWAGHWKPKCVGKPMPLTARDVADKLTRAITEPLCECVDLAPEIPEQIIEPSHHVRVAWAEREAIIPECAGRAAVTTLPMGATTSSLYYPPE